MKVNAVSPYNSGFKSQVPNDMSYLYTLNENYRPKYSFKDNKLEYIGGFAAFIIAMISLSKFIGRYAISKDIVELTGEIGLNKIKDEAAARTVAELKEKILYPMKILDMGEKSVLKDDFKTGLIIRDKDPKCAAEMTNAFFEHAEALGIHCRRIQYPQKSNRLKEVYKCLAGAMEYHKKTGKSVIVDIGDLGLISNLKVGKTMAVSNIEKELTSIPKGILWAGWTNKAENLPYFYMKIPVMMTRIFY